LLTAKHYLRYVKDLAVGFGNFVKVEIGVGDGNFGMVGVGPDILPLTSQLCW